MHQPPEYSVINERISISRDSWVVAICRKPKGKNPEHAFIVVEGKNSHGARVFKRYDFFRSREDSSKGEANASPRFKVSKDEDQKTRFEEQILNNEEIYLEAWSISRDQAKKLDVAIRRDRAVNYTYDVSGRHSIFAKSRHSSAPDVHNCFTWVQEKLLNLGQETNDGRFAEALSGDIYALIVSRTSRYISSGKAKDSTRCLFM